VVGVYEAQTAVAPGVAEPQPPPELLDVVDALVVAEPVAPPAPLALDELAPPAPAPLPVALLDVDVAVLSLPPQPSAATTSVVTESDVRAAEKKEGRVVFARTMGITWRLDTRRRKGNDNEENLSRGEASRHDKGHIGIRKGFENLPTGRRAERYGERQDAA
jgi:hypothetical protein